MTGDEMQPATRRDAPQFIKLVIAVALVAIFVLLSLPGSHLSFMILKIRQHELIEAYRNAPLPVIGLFFIATVALTALSVPGAIVLTTTAAGAIFGFSLGTLVVSFAAAVGSSAAFLVSRYLLRDWVNRKLGRQIARTVRGGDDLGWYLLSLRLIPLVPFFVVNFAMAVTRMSLARFYVLTQLGMLPCVMLYVNAGRQLGAIHAAGDILSLRVIGALALLGIFPVLAKLVLARMSEWRI